MRHGYWGSDRLWCKLRCYQYQHSPIQEAEEDWIWGGSISFKTVAVMTLILGTCSLYPVTISAAPSLELTNIFWEQQGKPNCQIAINGKLDVLWKLHSNCIWVFVEVPSALHYKCPNSWETATFSEQKINACSRDILKLHNRCNMTIQLFFVI